MPHHSLVWGLYIQRTTHFYIRKRRPNNGASPRFRSLHLSTNPHTLKPTIDPSSMCDDVSRALLKGMFSTETGPRPRNSHQSPMSSPTPASLTTENDKSQHTNNPQVNTAGFERRSAFNSQRRSPFKLRILLGYTPSLPPRDGCPGTAASPVTETTQATHHQSASTAASLIQSCKLAATGSRTTTTPGPDSENTIIAALVHKLPRTAGGYGGVCKTVVDAGKIIPAKPLHRAGEIRSWSCRVQRIA